MLTRSELAAKPGLHPSGGFHAKAQRIRKDAKIFLCALASSSRLCVKLLLTNSERQGFCANPDTIAPHLYSPAIYTDDSPADVPGSSSRLSRFRGAVRVEPTRPNDLHIVRLQQPTAIPDIAGKPATRDSR